MFIIPDYSTGYKHQYRNKAYKVRNLNKSEVWKAVNLQMDHYVGRWQFFFNKFYDTAGMKHEYIRKDKNIENVHLKIQLAT